jgi:phage gp36-like protein
MAYTTATRFIQEFGLEETTQLLMDEQRVLTSVLLMDAIAVADGGGWTGTPSQAEMDGATAALARMNRKLVTVSNYMDGYLRSAVTLPLSPADANAGTLEECCLALARCGLADDCDNATERMDKVGEQWRAWLKDVQAGRVSLVGAAGEEVATRGKVRTGQAASAFNWGTFPPRSW